jgi:hypothetical protein
MSIATRNPFCHDALIVAVLVVCATAARGQVKSVTISEPAMVKVDDLFKQADLVAIMRVLSGDSEHYPVTVYKAEVINAFKGVRDTEHLYFGPFVYYGVGREYLAFLRRAKEELRASRNLDEAGLNYGTIGVSYQVMYDGYSVMPVEYACVFDEEG